MGKEIGMTARALHAATSDASGQLLTLADVLTELDIPRSTFFRWKALGQAPRTIKLPNGGIRIRRRDLTAWLAAREETNPRTNRRGAAA